MTERPGFRREANQIGMISELFEKNPDLPRSSVTISISSKDGVTAVFHCWGLTRGEDDEYIGAEAEMLERVKLFPDVKWVRNDPTAGSFNESYYEMTGEWHGVTGGHHSLNIVLRATRADLCERVVTMTHEVEEEIPDPELVKEIPLKKVTVVKEIVEWQCNEALSRVNL